MGDNRGGMSDNGERVIWRVDTYEDDEGRVVIQRNPLRPGDAQYFGRGMVMVASPQGRGQVGVTFRIEADGVRAAFEAWGESYAAAVEAMKADAARPRIVGPGGVPVV